MEQYTHLSMRERCLLKTFLTMDLPINQIAERMKRDRFTLYRKLDRSSYYGYMPGKDHE